MDALISIKTNSPKWVSQATPANTVNDWLKWLIQAIRAIAMISLMVCITISGCSQSTQNQKDKVKSALFGTIVQAATDGFNTRNN